MLKDELESVAKRQNELATLMKSQDEEPRPLIHPTMSRRYRSETDSLANALAHGGAAEAREQVRKLIEKIVLSPKNVEDDLSIDLYGDLAGILRIASEDKSMKGKGKIEKPLESMTANDNHNFKPSVNW